ncbi:MAG: riboflavin synthase [Coprococcus sp.]
MFTGIIEEIGTVKQMIPGKESYRLTVSAEKVLEGTKVGDSIATNGICLTVTSIRGNSFDADVMAETVRRTNLSSLHAGSRVNLERALTLSSRLGGHIVSGHIDGTGTITSMVREDNAVWITVSAKSSLLKYMIEKGSIAIDGISLTLAYVDDECFKVSVIPHTGEETILLKKKPGDTVNLECDLIGKYVEKLLRCQSEDEKDQTSGGITEAFLIENGFM